MITVRFGPVDDPFESTTTEWEDPDDAKHFAETMALDESLWVEFDEIAAFAAQIEKGARLLNTKLPDEVDLSQFRQEYPPTEEAA